MIMKKCIICSELKNLNDFYKHNQMSDGHVNKCKECCKEQSRKRQRVLRSTNPNWVEKERERAREKYVRLNYKDKQKQWDSDKPWKNYQEYKNLSRNLSLPKGFEAHHWSYTKPNILSVFIMDINKHREAHTYLTLDLKERCFRLEDGTLLDTKDKHEKFLKKHNLI